MAITKKMKDAAKANKAKALKNVDLIAKLAKRNDRADGNGILSVLPENDYILSDIAVTEGEFSFIAMTFVDETGKEFIISQGAILNPVYSEEGKNLNTEEWRPTVDDIGNEYHVEHAATGLRPLFVESEWALAGADYAGKKFFSVSKDDYYKGKKAIAMSFTA